MVGLKPVKISRRRCLNGLVVACGRGGGGGPVRHALPAFPQQPFLPLLHPLDDETVLLLPVTREEIHLRPVLQRIRDAFYTF